MREPFPKMANPSEEFTRLKRSEEETGQMHPVLGDPRTLGL